MKWVCLMASLLLVPAHVFEERPPPPGEQASGLLVPTLAPAGHSPPQETAGGGVIC